MTTTTDNTTHANLLKLVRYASENINVGKTKRDAAIREAHRAGSSLKEIAAASGISSKKLQQIVNRS